MTKYILERYASRWAIEVTFRDLKQLLGFSESQAWTRLAVLRTAPFVGIVYSVVVLWYAEFGAGVSGLIGFPSGLGTQVRQRLRLQICLPHYNAPLSTQDFLIRAVITMT